MEVNVGAAVGFRRLDSELMMREDLAKESRMIGRKELRATGA